MCSIVTTFTSDKDFFVDRVFSVFDRDKDGKISLAEFMESMMQVLRRRENFENSKSKKSAGAMAGFLFP